MKIVPVHPPRIDARVLCIKCGTWVETTRAFADLHGVPFVTFYCPPCAGEVIKKC